MSANMKPPAAATDAFMQDLARKGNADDVPDRKFEGVHIQKNGDQVPPPSALKKKKPGHKPMSSNDEDVLMQKNDDQVPPLSFPKKKMMMGHKPMSSNDEGVHMQKNDDQVPPPSFPKKTTTRHKPMSAAQQKSNIAWIQERLKLFKDADAAAQPPGPMVDTTPAEMVEPVAKKRKLPDPKQADNDVPTTMNLPPPEATAPTTMNTPPPEATAPTTMNTPPPEATTAPPNPDTAAPEPIASSSRRSSRAHFPPEAGKLMDEMNNIVPQMEKELSRIIRHVSELSLGEDNDAIQARVLELGWEWLLSNRDKMRNMVQFMARNGIVGIGGVEVPSGSLEVMVQQDSEETSSSDECVKGGEVVEST